MLLSTTHSIEGASIEQYHGLVSGTAANGVNFVRDFFSRMRDFFGGRVSSLEAVVTDTRSQAFVELSKRAEAAGANAVIGIQIAMYTTREGVLLFSVTGTAVTAIPKDVP